MSNVRPNAVCIAQLRSILQASSRFRFDDRASSRVLNPKDGRVTKWCDLRETRRASSATFGQKTRRSQTCTSGEEPDSRRTSTTVTRRGTVPAEDPFTTIGRRLKQNAVRAAIKPLPDAQQRQVLRLMYVDGRLRIDLPKSVFTAALAATTLVGSLAGCSSPAVVMPIKFSEGTQHDRPGFRVRAGV